MFVEASRTETQENAPLLQEVERAFVQSIQDIKEQGALILMPTFYPQRGNLLEETARIGGVPCLIIGGNIGEQEYPHVRQIGLPGMDAGAVHESYENGVRIVQQIPLDVQRIVLFEYQSYDWFWKDLIAQLRPDITIIAEATGYTHPVLEGKEHLTELLLRAGLTDHIIPNMLIEQAVENDTELLQLYERLKNKDNGKLVIQRCGAGHTEEGGGKTTTIVDSLSNFQSVMRSDGTKKVSTYIDGHEANISWFCGNIIPNPKGLGSLRLTLPEGIDVHAPDAIQQMLKQTREAGLDEAAILVLVGRASIKAVGDPTLTAQQGNGVGNDLSYQYPLHIQEQIFTIGQRLGRTMALAGKVGLAGADLIIDPSGHVWVNEVNDRQQGPTAQLSADARRAGLPGLDMIAWLSYYVRFNQPETRTLFFRLQTHADAISRAYADHHEGSFYLKLNSKHGNDTIYRTTRSLEPGLYAVKPDKERLWMWKKIGETHEPPFIIGNPARHEPFFVRLAGPVIQAGDIIPSGKQMLRIEGKVGRRDAHPIFVTEEGKSRIDFAWRIAINALYEELFGTGYNERDLLTAERV